MSDRRVLLTLLLTTAIGAGAVRAGSLDPPGPPAPTMQTLAEMPPSWLQQLLPAARFQLVLGGAAVLDKETGLVWEQAPTGGVLFYWKEAVIHCYEKVVGDRMGWRLPTVEELATLIDPSGTGYPTLPPGHPFELPAFFPPSGVAFWTITTYPDEFGDTRASWAVSFENASLVFPVKRDILFNAWCVRGGHGYDFAGQHD